MFILNGVDFLALIGLYVQAFMSWVFVAVLASMCRHGRAHPAFRSFLAAFLALATSLSVMGIRFFRAHDIVEPSGIWSDGQLWPTIAYIIYMGLKLEFGYWLVVGSYQLSEDSTPSWLGRVRWPMVLGFASTPLLLPHIDQLLVVQAVGMVGCALISLRALAPLRRNNFGFWLVGASLIGLAGIWLTHAAAVFAHGSLFSYMWLPLNSYVDLTCELALGLGLIISMLQVANRRQLEAERERKRLGREMERDERLRALGTVVSGVAHELNNPLTAILGYANVLQESSDQPELAAIIIEQAERCQGIVQNLSVLSNQSTRPVAQLDLRELIDRVVRGLSPQLTRGGRRIVNDCPPDLRFDADQLGMEQVFSNLIVNGLHACPSQGTVRVEARSTDDEVVIDVIDDGAGVDPEIRERLFDPFFTTKEPGRGTGLGLSITHAIVHHHGGTVEVDPAERAAERGATFRVRLPIAPPRTKGAEPRRAFPHPRTPSDGSVMIIDDDPAVRRALMTLAGRSGWHVVEASSAEEALEAQLVDMDAIVCDLRMPGLGGAGFYDRLRDQAPEVLERVVFLTGDLTSMESMNFESRCTRPVLQKPIKSGVLLASIATAAAARTSDGEDTIEAS